MANNIQIVGNIINSTIVSRYNDDDIKLLSSQEIQKNFGDIEDYIEYYVYDAGGNLLNSDINYKNFKLPSTVGSIPYPNEFTSNTNDSIPSTDVGIISNTNSQTGSLYPVIEIDPVLDLQNLGYTSGEFSVRYNFFTNKISSPSADLFIKEISPDRTEIGVISTTLSNEEIEEGFNLLTNEISSSIYFSDYLLNFGNNQQALSVNLALNKLESGYEIYFKLYEPLPENITEKTSLWVVDEKVDPYVFNINLDTLILPPTGSQLRGPNFNIPIEQQGTISTGYENYNGLLNNLQSIQSSSYSKILNLLSTQSIDINVDYTNFSNFSFFGSAEQRLKNFYTKVKQIEDYNNLITTYTPYISTTSSLQLEILSSKNNINDIISKFDGFEYYLYFESSSYAWPKSTSTLPYTLFSTSSLIAETWYNNYTSSAKVFDENNVNSLKNSIPAFLLDDCDNNQYLVFLDMIGQYFDNIWIFLKSITDINDANNNLEQGVSKDLVYHVLKSYGIKLYNSQEGEDLNQFLIGLDSGSVNFDDNFSPTGSYLNNIPRKDLLAEIYKRIYHNLPYLVKNKGTVTGIEGLITTFGITGSILNAKEFGGGTKSELLKGYNNEKVRIIDNTITGSVLSPFINLNQPPTSSIEFRDDDLHYLDVSFSPQTQIDTYISGAIASNNPSFNLDDYIGDPRQQYSSSYSDLDTQRKLYFETGVIGYAPFTGSNMDYNGFIRLIQFFDNALFKMIEDFIPARTSLSTGITINSPVLERNKVSYSKPTLNEQEIYDADFEGPRIQPQYGFLYNNLTGSKEAFYNGELSGSQIDIYNTYFLPNNFNPYLQPISSSTPSDLNVFYHSDFNVLLNNVSGSRQSILRKDIEYIIGNTGSLENKIILSPSELQDSNLSLTSYNNSRYLGSKVNSVTYNTYTPASGSYNGDKSFGKTAAIDHNVRKLGLFTQVDSSSFFPRRSNVILKYLVDEKGNLTELNQQNKHWEEIQNTFIAGDISTIALFDNQKYSNQKFTDGEKIIYNSGYSYEPLLYYSLSSSFVNFLITDYIANNFVESRFNTNGVIAPGSLTYPVNNSYYKIVNNIFNNILFESDSSSFVPGIIGGTSKNTVTNYTSPKTNNYNINLNLKLNPSYNQSVTSNVYTPNAGFVTYNLDIYKNPTEQDIQTPSGNNSLINIEKTFLYLEGRETLPTNNAIGVVDNNTSNLSSYISSNNIVDAPSNISVAITYLDNFVSGTDRIVFTFKVTAIKLEGGETIRIQTSEKSPGISTYVTVDQSIIDNNPDLSSRMNAFANKIVNELSGYSSIIDFVVFPTIANISDNSFEITMQVRDQGGSNDGPDNRARFKAFSSTMFKSISPNAGPLTIKNDIRDINNNIIIPKNTTLYQYTSLNDINIFTGNVTPISFWSTKSQLKLNYKSNQNSYNGSLYPNFQYASIYYKYFYIDTGSLGKIYHLPQNIVTFNNGTSTLTNISENDIFNINQSFFLKEDDSVYFILRESNKFPSNFLYSFNQGSSQNSYLKITDNPNIISLSNDGKGFLDLTSTPTQLILSEALSNALFNTNIYFDPSSSIYTSDLYSKYGDVGLKFNTITNGDILLIKDFNNNVFEFTILSKEQINNKIYINLLTPIPDGILNNIKGTSIDSSYYEILFLKKDPNETLTIIAHQKPVGKTSYGFIIPQNLHPDVLANIDTITKEVKQKLLADQQGLTN